MYNQDLRKKVVFLGTPTVAEKVLETIVKKAFHSIKIIAVVTQPPARSKRSTSELILTPVHSKAIELGIPVFHPESAKNEDFLKDLSLLEPDLCLTAAYGNFLSKRFLSIPKYGTVNIHPSLLPLYRGASPVQRCLEQGDKTSGVTVLYTELEMDAGPIIAQEIHDINDSIKADELLNLLFQQGTELFIRSLSKIFTSSYSGKTQDHTKATHAKKIEVHESFLDFSRSALECHNKVRAFNMWPGTKGQFILAGSQIEIKIITTEVSENPKNLKLNEIYLGLQTIDICCGDKKVLSIKELQLPGKKIVSARDFMNGLKGQSLTLIY